MAAGAVRTAGRWRTTRTTGQAGPFHARVVPPDAPPSVWVHRIERPALVLGSAQPIDVVRLDEAARRRIEVTRRRSGGGLVFVHPDHARWIDVVVPRGDPHWDDDVRRSPSFLGQAWEAALRAEVAGPAGVEVHRHEGALVPSAWSSLLCFAGLGPGEVTINGAKVVGISQRRTRDWARFQCLLLAEPDLEQIARLVAPPALPGPEDELLALPIGHPVPLDATVDAFLGALA